MSYSNGYPEYERKYRRDNKSTVIAFILCLLGFTGLAGIHRMYVGKVGSGVLFFLTLGFLGIGTIFDVISILSGGFTDSFGEPLT